MTRWIPIDGTNHLPAPLDDVLIVVDDIEGPSILMGYIRRDGFWAFTGDLDARPISRPVTHWMRLPLLPDDMKLLKEAGDRMAETDRNASGRAY